MGVLVVYQLDGTFSRRSFGCLNRSSETLPPLAAHLLQMSFGKFLMAYFSHIQVAVTRWDTLLGLPEVLLLQNDCSEVSSAFLRCSMFGSLFCLFLEVYLGALSIRTSIACDSSALD